MTLRQAMPAPNPGDSRGRTIVSAQTVSAHQIRLFRLVK
jgi:hypothetical protein